jgi:hypothetical protein
MFFPPLKIAFDVFDIKLDVFCKLEALYSQAFCWFTRVGCHFKNIQVVIFINLMFNNATFRFNEKVQNDVDILNA